MVGKSWERSLFRKATGEPDTSAAASSNSGTSQEGSGWCSWREFGLEVRKLGSKSRLCSLEQASKLHTALMFLSLEGA